MNQYQLSLIYYRTLTRLRVELECILDRDGNYTGGLDSRAIELIRTWERSTERLHKEVMGQLQDIAVDIADAITEESK